jgi:hypothetical protein
LAISLPAAAAPVLVVSYDARISQSLAQALEAEGGEVVAAKSLPPRATGDDLASRIKALVLELEPDFVLVASKPDIARQSTIVVANSRGQVLGRLTVDHRSLTSKRRVRRVAGQLMYGLAQAEAQAREQRRPIHVAGAFPAFAVPENAPYVTSP